MNPMLKQMRELVSKVELPWKLESPENDGRILQCDPRETIVHVPPCSPFNEDAIADRELIVFMVNNSPKLVNLLEAIDKLKNSGVVPMGILDAFNVLQAKGQ